MGRLSVQGLLSSAMAFWIVVSKVPFKLSTLPLLCEWYGALKACSSTGEVIQKVIKELGVGVPWSLSVVSDTLYLYTTSDISSWWWHL
ncbi:hypothetical protein GDO78_020235 [Eleutherodactylus coqui]|uniref:Secreted protein n=1 Tax=Eleutherodactylus coqui TaxID=57060 RepID=A0A8J6E8V1_ELECQ|nr:hypothetical protein GDO78_020235 [Eleutherodactylus coqui]